MSVGLALAGAATVLAGENQKSGPIGLAVILVLCVVSYLLFRSMSRHMRKVREEFPDDAAAPTTGTPTTGTPTTGTPTTATPTTATPTTGTPTTGTPTTATPTPGVPPLPAAGTDPARDADAATAEGPPAPEDGPPA